jgi:hypothetical protein
VDPHKVDHIASDQQAPRESIFSVGCVVFEEATKMMGENISVPLYAFP